MPPRRKLTPKGYTPSPWMARRLADQDRVAQEKSFYDAVSRVLADRVRRNMPTAEGMSALIKNAMRPAPVITEADYRRWAEEDA